MKRQLLLAGLYLAFDERETPHLPRRDSRKKPIVPARDMSSAEFERWLEIEARKAAECIALDLAYPASRADLTDDPDALSAEDDAAAVEADVGREWIEDEQRKPHGTDEDSILQARAERHAALAQLRDACASPLERVMLDAWIELAKAYAKEGLGEPSWADIDEILDLEPGRTRKAMNRLRTKATAALRSAAREDAA
jgi:hypothetical protein